MSGFLAVILALLSSASQEGLGPFKVTLEADAADFFNIGGETAMVKLVIQNVSSQSLPVPVAILQGRRLLIRYGETDGRTLGREASFEAQEVPDGTLIVPPLTYVARFFDIQKTLDTLVAGRIEVVFPIEKEGGSAADPAFSTWLLPDPASVRVRIHTDFGDMVMEFLESPPRDEGSGKARLLAPHTVNSFMQLVTRRFYDGLTFHRIVRNQFIQGGDPKGDGTGGPPAPPLEAEFSDQPHVKGVVSMARLLGDPDSAGSQFFIVHGRHLSDLDRRYTAFARLVDGYDALDAIAAVEVAPGNYRGEVSSPKQPVVIRSIRLEERQPKKESLENE
ncbi:MAG: peptidylprolyl isomerase [Planctomycetota bacterium]